jgi:hypothetical protein
MTDDEHVHVDLVVSLVAVLRDLHTRQPELVEQVCEDHGVEIDWTPDTTEGP